MRFLLNGSRRLLLLALLLWLGAASHAVAHGQVVSASVGTGRTAHPELSSPTSASWTIATPPIKGFSLQYGRRWLRDEVVRLGTTCDAYWPIGTNCRDEGIASRFRVYSQWYGLSYRRHHRQWLAEAGVRRVASTVDGTMQGVSTGRFFPIFLPEGSSTAWGYDFTLGRALFVPHVVAFARWSHERFGTNTFVDDVFAPFSQQKRVDIGSIGIEWSPPRGR